MNLAGLFHYAGGAYAAAISDQAARLMLRVSVEDNVQVAVMVSDRYAPADTALPWPMTPVATDGLFNYYVATVEIPSYRLRYVFRLADEDTTIFFGPRGPGDTPAESGHFELPYLYPDDTAPAWFYGAVLYEIMPDRFYPGTAASPEDRGQKSGGELDRPASLAWDEEPTRDGRYPGSLRGIKEKLDYVQSLGANTIYLTPLFAASSYHGYDINDYYAVNPWLGNSGDLKNLVAAAHARNMRVMLDGVFNHCGPDFFAFRDVRERGPASPYWNWFRIYGDQVCTRPPNYETFADGIANMPKLMTGNPAVMAYFASVGTHWLRTAGIDGWRLDVANEVHPQFWRHFRTRVRAENRDAVLLGEIWHDAAAYLGGDVFDSVMHYQWRDTVVSFLATGDADAAAFARTLARLQAQYSPLAAARLVTLIGSHDTPRFLTLADGRRERLVMAAVLLATLPGVPMVYYGDEIGMTGGPDPGCRRAMAWDHADQALLATFRRALHLRQAYPWLGWAEPRVVVADGNRNVLVLRLHRPPWNPPGVQVGGSAAEELHVLLNAGEGEYVVSPGVLRSGRQVLDVSSGEQWRLADGDQVVVPPGRVLVLL